MSGFANVNGHITSTDEATISITDRGFLYGDAAFETIRAYNGEYFAWKQHLKRLQQTCETLSLETSLSGNDLRSHIDATLAAAGYSDAYVRLSITRGSQQGRLTPQPEDTSSFVILVEPLPRGGIDGSAVWNQAATATITDVKRTPSDSLPASAKTHNYLNGILGRLDARSAGAEEALFLDQSGMLTEGATSNLFFVDDSVLKTPSIADLPILPGITRECVLALATEQHLTVRQGKFSPAELEQASEVFVTNSTWEIRPVSRIDAWSYDTGPITTQLMQAFDTLIERRCYA